MFSNYRLKSSLIAVLNTALADVGVTGFTVMSRSPQVMANRNRVILVDYLYSRRVGFQSAEQIVKPPTGSIKTAVEIPGKGWAISIEPPHSVFTQERWVEEVAWQMSVLRKRLVNDDGATRTGDDVAKMLVAWLNSSRGAAAMRSIEDCPFAPILAKEIRSRTYSDDSDIAQVEAMFDFRMSVVQTLDTPSADVKGLQVESYPI